MLDLTIWWLPGSFGIVNLMGVGWSTRLNRNTDPAGASTGSPQVTSGADQFNIHNEMPPSGSWNYPWLLSRLLQTPRVSQYEPSSTSKQLAQRTDLWVPFSDFSTPFSGCSHFFSFKEGMSPPLFLRVEGISHPAFIFKVTSTSKQFLWGRHWAQAFHIFNLLPTS